MSEQVQAVTTAFTRKRRTSPTVNPVTCHRGLVVWVIGPNGKWSQHITTGDERGAIPAKDYRIEAIQGRRRPQQGYGARTAYA